MAVQHHVRNPMEWGWDRLKETGQAIGSAASTMDGAWEAREMAPPVVRKIGLDDLRQALREGARDFGACRTDVVFLCMIYPIAGLIISRFAFDYGMLPLIFPLVSGFALIAPLFGVGLYEMSRRRELGTATGWADAFAVVRSPAIGSVMALGLVLIGRFGLWLAAAYFIYTVTLGPDQPVSAIAFARDAVTTPQGWTMVVAGICSTPVRVPRGTRCERVSHPKRSRRAPSRARTGHAAAHGCRGRRARRPRRRRGPPSRLPGGADRAARRGARRCAGRR